MNQDNTQNEKSDEQQLLDNGRALAGDILNQAVSNAQNVQDLNNKLHMLNCMSVHVLATNMFNRIKSTETTKEELLAETSSLIQDELELLYKHEKEMQIINPQNEKTDS